MNVLVTIQEVKIVERTYEVKGVNSLETAEKCAQRCAANQYQPNCYSRREIKLAPYFKTCSYEVLED